MVVNTSIAGRHCRVEVLRECLTRNRNDSTAKYECSEFNANTQGQYSKGVISIFELSNRVANARLTKGVHGDVEAEAFGIVQCT
jgi:hypothetical protein